ncbi:hypothetical protein ACPV5S_19135 [Vibrio astriarenae]
MKKQIPPVKMPVHKPIHESWKWGMIGVTIWYLWLESRFFASLVNEIGMGRIFLYSDVASMGRSLSAIGFTLLVLKIIISLFPILTRTHIGRISIFTLLACCYHSANYGQEYLVDKYIEHVPTESKVEMAKGFIIQKSLSLGLAFDEVPVSSPNEVDHYHIHLINSAMIAPIGMKVSNKLDIDSQLVEQVFKYETNNRRFVDLFYDGYVETLSHVYTPLEELYDEITV